MQLVWPSIQYLPGYIAALEKDWSVDNARGRQRPAKSWPSYTATPMPSSAAWSTAKRAARPSPYLIERNGGVLVEQFTKPAQFGATPAFRYRIEISASSAASFRS